MNRPIPFGFGLCGLFSLVLCVAMVAFVVDPANAYGWEGVLARGGGMLMAALALVTTEALWGARPWAFRASAALAATWALSMLLMSFLLVATPGMALWVVLPSFVVLGPMLAYIHNRTQQLWPRHGAPPRMPLPAASPYPPPHVAAARAASRP